MSLEVFPSDFIIWVPTQNTHAGTCWLLFIFSWWQIVLCMASQSIQLPFRHQISLFLLLVEVGVHTNRTFLSSFSFFVPEFYFYLFFFFLISSLQSAWYSDVPVLGLLTIMISSLISGGDMFYCAHFDFGLSPFTHILCNPSVLLKLAFPWC